MRYLKHIYLNELLRYGIGARQILICVSLWATAKYQLAILFEPLTRFKPLGDKRYKLNCLWALGNTLDAHWRFNTMLHR